MFILFEKIRTFFINRFYYNAFLDNGIAISLHLVSISLHIVRRLCKPKFKIFYISTLFISSVIQVNSLFSLTGCYLKLHSSRGVVSSSHFPPQFESTTYGVDHSSSPTWGCLLLLNVPGGSSAELTLRKLKLHRPHSRECHQDSQLQLATSTSWGPHQMVDGKPAHNSQQPSWSNLAEVHRWQVARTFCGKIQDYSKNLRTWQTFQPWVLIRYTSNQRNRHHIRGSTAASSSFFVFKFNILGPCLNVLLTEPSKTIELSDSDLVASPHECTFRIHVTYGYRIKLSVRLHDDDSIIPHENDLVKKEAVGDEELNYNSLLLQSGRCQISVQVEDATGHRVQCLNDHHPSASFSSLGNFLKFQAVVLRSMNQGIRQPTNVLVFLIAHAKKNAK